MCLCVLPSSATSKLAELQRQERAERRMHAPKISHDPLSDHVMRAAIEYATVDVPDEGVCGVVYVIHLCGLIDGFVLL